MKYHTNIQFLFECTLGYIDILDLAILLEQSSDLFRCDALRKTSDKKSRLSTSCLFVVFRALDLELLARVELTRVYFFWRSIFSFISFFTKVRRP